MIHDLCFCLLSAIIFIFKNRQTVLVILRNMTKPLGFLRILHQVLIKEKKQSKCASLGSERGVAALHDGEVGVDLNVFKKNQPA